MDFWLIKKKKTVVEGSYPLQAHHEKRKRLYNNLVQQCAPLRQRRQMRGWRKEVLKFTER